MPTTFSPSASSRSTMAPRLLAYWLLIVVTMIVAMVIVGGITRLTESGLSITEWKPVTGVLPPLSHADWMEEFHKYQQIPEYQQINRGMKLEDFKFIFFWEWSHRLLGRLIGVVFALPLAWFALRRAIPKGYGLRLIALLALGALQGAVGWWMVASGLVFRTDVSHYRLATHLVTALFIAAGTLWTALDLLALDRNANARPARLTLFATCAALALLIQLTWGAYVAGLNAGYVASDWPLMQGHFVPRGISWHGSLWATISSDPYLIHFFHRWWAWVTAIMLILLARRTRLAGNRRASITLNAAVGTQIFLGISTVMSGIALPIAVAHQGVGALVVLATTWAAHGIGTQRPTWS